MIALVAGDLGAADRILAMEAELADLLVWRLVALAVRGGDVRQAEAAVDVAVTSDDTWVGLGVLARRVLGRVRR